MCLCLYKLWIQEETCENSCLWKEGQKLWLCLTEVEVEPQQMSEQQEGEEAQYDCDEG